MKKQTGPMTVRQAIQTAEEIIRGLYRIISEEKTLDRGVERAMDGVRREQMKEVLEALPVDQLNRGKNGIRVSALTDRGIQNLWQVHQMTLPQLVRINGIGEAGAQKIKEISDEFAASARESVRIRLRVDDRSKANTELIHALYRHRNAIPVRKLAQGVVDAYSERIERAAEEAAPLQGGLSRLFTFGRRKAQAEAAYEYLKSLLTGVFFELSQTAAAQHEAIMRAEQSAVMADFEQNAAAYIAHLESLTPNDPAKERASTGLPVSLIEEIDTMEVDLHLLKATLRPYQLFGCKYALHQGRVLLGDEMGLGKTVQAIGAMAATAAGGVKHFMAVCPASVLVNWVREVGVHSHLKAVKIHGADEAALEEWIRDGGVAVTTYESISRFELPEGFTVGMLVVDEAHYVKNPEAKRTQAMKRLLERTDRVLFMSGTPLENRVEEMCFLVSLLDGDLAQEIRRYTNLATAAQFREKLAPVYLRRTREDVLTELPDLIESMEWSDLGAEEARLYKKAVREGKFAEMRQVSWQAEAGQSTKAQRLMELREEAEEDRRKLIIFSFFLNTIRKVEALLGDKCAGVITGSIPPEELQAMIDRFKAAPDGSALVCQVQAGGTGLNIQTASVIVFCEPQLKPSIEHQAVARAYRMGQVRDVLVYRLLCEESVDERILELLKVKQTQFDHFADESAAGEEMMKLDEKDMIADIIRAEQARLESEEAAPAEHTPA